MASYFGFKPVFQAFFVLIGAFQGVLQRHSHVDTHIVRSFPGVTDSTAWRPVIWNMADSDSSEKSIYYHLFLNFPPPLRWPSPCSDTSDAYSASLDIDLDTADAILSTEFVNTQPENRDGARLPAQTTKFVVAVLDRLATSDLWPWHRYRSTNLAAHCRLKVAEVADSDTEKFWR